MADAAASAPLPHPGDLENHVVRELGFGLEGVGHEMHGTATIIPTMHVPGTDVLRASILATWIDITAGYLAIDEFAPRVPVTLDLDVHFFDAPAALSSIHTVGRVARAGRSVLVLTVDVTDAAGAPLAMSTASFMAAPNPALQMPTIERGFDHMAPRPPTLRVPFAERARCERRSPGVAVLPRTEDGVNASNTISGGLIALAVEEAVLSSSPPGATISSLSMKYLQPLRDGPAVATATASSGLGRVEVRDSGRDDRLAVIATTRTFPPH